jgi:hypothetical protein
MADLLAALIGAPPTCEANTAAWVPPPAARIAVAPIVAPISATTPLEPPTNAQLIITGAANELKITQTASNTQ